MRRKKQHRYWDENRIEILTQFIPPLLTQKLEQPVFSYDVASSDVACIVLKGIENVAFSVPFPLLVSNLSDKLLL